MTKKQNKHKNYTLYSVMPSKDGKTHGEAKPETLSAYDLFSDNDEDAKQEALNIIEKHKLNIQKCNIEFYEKIDEETGTTRVIDLS